MFSKEVIGKMKKGAYLVNNARGGIVDREAIVAACKSGQLGGEHCTTLQIEYQQAHSCAGALSIHACKPHRTEC